MHTLLKYIQLIISLVLIAAIVVQNRSTGFSQSGSNAFQTQRRGAEKLLYNITIVLTVLFVLTSLSFIFVK